MGVTVLPLASSPSFALCCLAVDYVASCRFMLFRVASHCLTFKTFKATQSAGQVKWACTAWQLSLGRRSLPVLLSLGLTLYKL